MNSDEGARKIYHAEKFNEILLSLPETGPMSLAQNRPIQKSIRNIVTILSQDQNLNLADLTPSTLRQKDLSPETIAEILR